MFVQFRKLYQILTPAEKRRSIGVFIIMVAAAAFQVVGVGSLYPFLQLVTQPDSIQSSKVLALAYTKLGFTSEHNFIVASGVAVLLLILSSNGLLAYSMWKQLRFKWWMNHSLSHRLLHRYLSKDYPYFLTRNTAEMGKNVLSETKQISVDLINPAMLLVSSTTLAASMLSLLLLVNPSVTALAALFLGGGYACIYALTRNKMRDAGKHYTRANRDRFKHAQEALGAIKVVKLLGREEHFLDQYSRPSAEYSLHLARNEMYRRLPKYLIEGLAFGGLMVAILIMILAGQNVSALMPTVGLFLFAGYRLMPSFRDALSSAIAFDFHTSLLDELHDDLKPSYSDDAKLRQPIREPLPFREEIRVERVTFQYEGSDRPALSEINVAIPKDASVAFIGETGAGKSTLVDTLLGLLIPTSGAVTVDGVKIDPRTAPSWRNNIGYVPQEIYLTDDTIARNIAFGLPDEEIDMDAVIGAANVAHAHEFITADLPEGYETRIGERGVRLSGGQRQRIGIARALYNDPDVLILDEATSDIDGRTEAAITEAIEALAGEKTVVVVAHRYSTIRNCNQIHILEEGQIIERGTYDELLRRSKRFRAMAQTSPTAGKHSETSATVEEG